MKKLFRTGFGNEGEIEVLCPGCNKQLKEVPKNRVSITEGKEHLWGICPHCREMMHFVYVSAENHLYGWLESKEAPYAKLLLPLADKKTVLYIPELENPESLFAYTRNFAMEQRWTSGFVVNAVYQQKAKILAAVHPTVILPEVLFPEIPSFIAERLIYFHLKGKLFCSIPTLSDKFEVWAQ